MEINAMETILTKYSESFLEHIWTTLLAPDHYLNKVALTVATILILAIIRTFLLRWVARSHQTETTKWNIQKWVKRSLLIVFILILLTIWLQAMNAFILILLGFGLFGVVLVRGLTENFIGWFIIERRHYFKIGSRIEMNGYIGDVLTVNPIHFELLEVRGDSLTSDAHTGRVIKVPNKSIFEKEIHVIGIGNAFTWHEIRYVLTFESNWEEAKKIMLQAANTYYEREVKAALHRQKSQWIIQDGDAPIFSLDTNEYGIVVAVRYLLHYHNGASARTAIHERVLTSFSKREDIEMASIDIRMT